jgi:hypothetical protein
MPFCRVLSRQLPSKRRERTARSYLVLLCIFLAFLVAGCGGGGGTTSGGGDSGPGSNDILTLHSITPITVTAGTPGVTLDVVGLGFQSGAVVKWNGTALPTTWNNVASLTASVPASDLAVPGSAQVTVTNPGTGGATSSAITFVVSYAPATKTTVRTVPGISFLIDEMNDMVWDSAHSKIYISVPSNSATVPNSIVAVDPISGSISASVAIGKDPYALTLSSDDSYLWVGVNGDGAIQRMQLPQMTKDIRIPLPTDAQGRPQQAVSLAAAPFSPHTVAVVAGTVGSSPPGNGVYVFDDATHRPTFVPGFQTLPTDQVDNIQWGKDETTLYGNLFYVEDVGGISIMKVTPSGVTMQRQSTGFGIAEGRARFDRGNGLLYSGNAAYDPVQNTLLGSFDMSPSDGWAPCAADSSLNRFYCVMNISTGVASWDHTDLWVYDLKTYGLVNRVSLSDLVTGRPVQLIRWGKSGLALTTFTDHFQGEGGLFLIDGGAVNDSGVADVDAGSVTADLPVPIEMTPAGLSEGGASAVGVYIRGTGFTPDSEIWANFARPYQQKVTTQFFSSTAIGAAIPIAVGAGSQYLTISVKDTAANQFASGAFVFSRYPANGPQMTSLNLAVLGLACDSKRNLLYAAVTGRDLAHPNSIAVLDPVSGGIVRTVQVNGWPDLLSLSSDGNYLFVGFADSTAMTRLSLPGLDNPLSWPLGPPSSAGSWLAGDMKAAPASPHTTAVSLFHPGWNPPDIGGVAIYDDGSLRPNLAPSFGGLNQFSALAWGNTDSVLASAETNADDSQGKLFALDVSPSGASILATNTNFSNLNYNTASPTIAGLQSDSNTGLVYSDNGTVADPATAVRAPIFGLSGIVMPVASLHRIFTVGSWANSNGTPIWAIASYNDATYNLVSGVTLGNLFGIPVAMARWGTSGLAVATMNYGDPGGYGGGEPPSGVLYLIQASDLLSTASPPSGASLLKDLKPLPWTPPTKGEILKMMKERRLGRSSERVIRSHPPS